MPKNISAVSYTSPPIASAKTGQAVSAQSRATAAARAPSVSVKERPRENVLIDSLFEFTELSNAKVGELVRLLSQTGARLSGRAAEADDAGREDPEVRAAFNKMRFYVASTMFEKREARSAEAPHLARFAELWQATPEPARRAIGLGPGFEVFVARALPQQPALERVSDLAIVARAAEGG